MKAKMTTLSLLMLIEMFFPAFQSSAGMTWGTPDQRKSEAEALCERLSEIRMAPMKDEPVDDEVYNKIMSQGQSVVPCLIEKITDRTKMKFPYSVPTARGFRVGDLAFFLLVEITGIEFEQMLPDSVKSKIKEEGVYAYYRYVGKRGNREELQQKWQAWIKEQSR